MNGNKPFILRYFKLGDNQKIITAINKKIYFSKDQNVTPGYYVGSIIEEYDKHGVIDTMPLNKVPVKVWTSNQVGGVFVKVNKEKKKIDIFLSKAPENRNEKIDPIFSIELDEKQAKELWGIDYKKYLLKKKDGIKKVHPKGYLPFEQLKNMDLKLKEKNK